MNSLFKPITKLPRATRPGVRVPKNPKGNPAHLVVASCSVRSDGPNLLAMASTEHSVLATVHQKDVAFLGWVVPRPSASLLVTSALLVVTRS